MPIRGEVWTVDLEPTLGHEQGKIRPCIVVSNDLMNTRMGMSIVVPVTGKGYYIRSTGQLSPVMVEVLPPEGGLVKASYSMAFQARTVSHSRLIKKLGALSDATLKSVVRTVHNIIEP
jgi:mRNA interferase MazF